MGTSGWLWLPICVAAYRDGRPCDATKVALDGSRSEALDGCKSGRELARALPGDAPCNRAYFAGQHYGSVSINA